MKQLDQLLTTIAREHLGIATLKTRRSDRLDFHDIPVWGIRAALEAAYNGGTQSAGTTATDLLKALKYVAATLKLRHIDDATDDEVEEALTIADSVMARANSQPQDEPTGSSHPQAGENGRTLKQHVDITVKLSLWLDASMSSSAIIGLTKSRLSAAFAMEIAAMLHPIQIVGLQEEAEIYGTEPCLPVRFDAYEIQPCHRYFDIDEPDLAFVEPCEPYEADFWTVYGHIPGEGVQAIGDFDTSEHAEEVFARITGQRYTGRMRKTGGANHE
jgi:hypothetical protein